MKEGREEKVERMSLDLGGYIDGQWEENPAHIKHFGNVLEEFLEEIRENSILFALN